MGSPIARVVPVTTAIIESEFCSKPHFRYGCRNGHAQVKSGSNSTSTVVPTARTSYIWSVPTSGSRSEKALNSPASRNLSRRPDLRHAALTVPPGIEHLGRLDLQTHRTRLLRSALVMCGNEPDAQDLVQEAFLRALESAPQFRGDSTISYVAAWNPAESTSPAFSGTETSGPRRRTRSKRSHRARFRAQHRRGETRSKGGRGRATTHAQTP